MSLITNPAEKCTVIIKHNTQKPVMMLTFPGTSFMTVGGLVSALILAPRLNPSSTLINALKKTINDLHAKNPKAIDESMIVMPTNYINALTDSRYQITLDFKNQTVDLSKYTVGTLSNEIVLITDGLNADLPKSKRMTICAINYPVDKNNLSALPFKKFNAMVATIYQAQGNSDAPDFEKAGYIAFINKKKPNTGWFFINRG